MYKNEIIAMTEQQKARNNNNTFSYGLGYAANFENDEESKLLAKKVEYCLVNEKVATFKNPDKIATIVRKRSKGSVQSMSNHVVIYNSSSGLAVQYSKNDAKDQKKINTTEIFIGKNNRIEGRSKTYTMIKDQSTIGNYLEKELSSCEINNMNSFSIENATTEEVSLYKEMKICQSLLGPVVNKLGKKKAVNTSNELDLMLNKQNNSENTQNLDSNKKK